MSRAPRRLRNLDLDELQGAEPVEELHENIAENENNNTLRGPPDNEGLLAHMPRLHPRSPIKIIWPNGEVRQVFGDFTIANLVALEGAKVIVGTDENGVPNERSASILGQHLGHIAETSSLAPLHIERWDNALFKTHKQSIIKEVEEKFDFPRQTIQLTRDWILKTVNNRWRAYKSKLKKLYFNREERTLDEIIKGKPTPVNEHQWRALVGFWCKESHRKLCETNSRCGKQQKNSHTAGRKSHARLKKELEEKKKGKVHRLELWEAAHKRKNGRFSTDKVATIMNASHVELQKRKDSNNGNLSAQDFNEVFNEMVAKELKARGYYDDKYWSEGGVSKGVTFIYQTEEERRYQEKVNTMENKMNRMSGIMQNWIAFMSKKFPEEDFIKEMEADLHEDEDEEMGEESDTEGPKDSIHNVHSPSNDVREPHVQSSTQEDNGNASTNLPRDPILTSMRNRRVKAPNFSLPESSQMEVYLISLRNKGRIVAKAKLVSNDSRSLIGGTMLGTQYFGVHVEGLENLEHGNKGDEEIPRPFFAVRTLVDAIGYVIAWPRTHVKKATSSTRS